MYHTWTNSNPMWAKRSDPRPRAQNLEGWLIINNKNVQQISATAGGNEWWISFRSSLTTLPVITRHTVTVTAARLSQTDRQQLPALNRFKPDRTTSRSQLALSVIGWHAARHTYSHKPSKHLCFKRNKMSTSRADDRRMICNSSTCRRLFYVKYHLIMCKWCNQRL